MPACCSSSTWSAPSSMLSYPSFEYWSSCDSPCLAPRSRLNSDISTGPSTLYHLRTVDLTPLCSWQVGTICCWFWCWLGLLRSPDRRYLLARSCKYGALPSSLGSFRLCWDCWCLAPDGRLDVSHIFVQLRNVGSLTTSQLEVVCLKITSTIKKTFGLPETFCIDPFSPFALSSPFQFTVCNYYQTHLWNTSVWPWLSREHPMAYAFLNQRSERFVLESQMYGWHCKLSCHVIKALITDGC